MALPTITDIVAAANPFGTTTKGQWNLARGVYTQNPGKNKTAKSIIFFYEIAKGEDQTKQTSLEQISDTGGRRLAIYKYPYRDGQAIADLGREGETFNFNIKFTGQNYQSKLAEFIDVVVNSNVPGTIIHPTRSGTDGAIKVKYHDHEFIHRHDEFNAVTIRVKFLEDATDTIAQANIPLASTDSALRSTLQTLANTQQDISSAIFTASGLLLLPGAIINGMQNRITSITGQVSRLLGQLAATFSSDAQLKTLAAQSAGIAGGIPGLNSGTVATGNGTQAQLPPVYQVGFDPTTQSSIDAQSNDFISANQITPQQAVFAANQARASITDAIDEVNENLGNDGYTIVLLYRGLAISIQEAAEASISATQSLVKIYTVPTPMSLRKIAVNNGLDPDRQNDIESLNPYISSVNYVPAGTKVTVPAA